MTSIPHPGEQCARDEEYAGENPKASACLSDDEIDQLIASNTVFGGQWLERAGRTQGTHSQTTRYQDRRDGGQTPIVVKHTNASTPEKAAESVTREFMALETTWKLGGKALEGSLPKPLMVLPEYGLLVTEMLPGVPWSRVLQRSINYLTAPFRTADVSEIARKIGIWLCQFHQATQQPALTHDSQAFEQEVTLQLEGCVRRGLSEAEAEQIRRTAVDGSRRIEGRLLAAASRHGDFTPRNILASGDRICVIDFENFVTVDTIYEDVGKFVAFLALLKGRPGYSKAAIDSVIKSFLGGYGIAERTLVDLFALKAATRIFAHRGARRTPRSLMLDPLYVRQLIYLGREHARTLDLASQS